MHEQLFGGLAKRPAPAAQTGTIAPVPAAASAVRPSTIEGVLDELVAGKITRDEAALQLREMMSPHSSSV
jgi:hypothetical protein